MARPLLLTFATELEARQSLRALSAERQEGNLWHFAGGAILVTGMGVIRAAIELSRHLERSGTYSALWNLGFAASLHEESVGTIWPIECICRFNPWTCDATSQRLFQTCFPRIGVGGAAGGKTLVSVDVPVHQARLKSRLARTAQLLDMEGYAVISVAKDFALTTRCIKIISDRAEKGGRAQLHAGAEAFSLELSRWLSRELKELG